MSEILTLPGSPSARHALASMAAHPLVRFLVVGSIGFGCDAGLYGVLSGGGIRAAIARGVSLPLATLLTWWLNRRFTFANRRGSPALEILRYTLVAVGAQGINYGLFLALLPLLGPVPALVSCAAIGALLSFCGQRFFTFARLRSAV